ncbi:MAG: helix-turn-helix domain-containing protein [Coprobacillus sp.]
MEIGNQIKTKRLEMNLSQDELADKIYVTRQTISNWENNKNYPDIHSLLLLSTLFGISIDQLIKGDIDMIKEEIKREDILKFNRSSQIFSVLFAVTIISIAPLFYYLKTYGMIVWAIIFIITMIYALKVEKYKKENNIQTYKEILAFINGERLDEISKHQEQGKKSYQKFIIALCFGLGSFIIVSLMLMILSKF